MKFLKIFLALIVVLSLVLPVSSKPYHKGLKIIVSPSWIGQGKSFSVKIYSTEPLKEVGGSVFGKRITFYKSGDHYRGIIGVPLNAKAGKYKLHLTMKQKDGAIREHDKYVYVQKTKFDRVSYWLDPEKRKLLSPEIVERGWEKIHKEIVRETPRRLWKGPFRVPSVGTTSMRFGSWQIINGETRDQHRGVDIAGATYYRVRASNSGQVVLAEELEAFGKTVVINHGQGIYSLYFHLSRMDVSKNAIVWKGKIIGMMGSSGVATGVHLHWGLSVHDTRVDPMQWRYFY
jgi:murein DD-endopeptidase MepM/ murein hydrolase activator NlpD